MTSLEEAKRIVAEAEKFKNARRRISDIIRETNRRIGSNIGTRTVRKDTGRITFSNEIDGWRVNYHNPITNETCGMTSVVTKENILVNVGGGTYQLQGNILITDDEIAELNAGRIPARLLRDPDYEY